MKGLLGLGLLMVFGSCSAQNSDASAILDRLLEGYDKRIRPNFGGAPVEVGVTMYFLRIFDISTKDQSMKSDFYFRQMWRDPRLAFNATPEVPIIVLGEGSSNLFWQPDTFFAEGYKKYFEPENIFLRIAPDGSAFKSIRLLLTSRVDMDLHYFPFDSPTAVVSMESYSYTAKDIRYKWAKGFQSVGLSSEVGTNGLAVTRYEPRSEVIHLSSGNYSRLMVNLGMARQGVYYLNHFYLPAVISFLFVWASFWFHPTATVARVLLVLISFLTGNYLLTTSWNFYPVVGYSTMLDRFITFGLVLSALALAQTALVVYLERRVRKTQQATSVLEKGEKQTEKNQLGDAEKPGLDSTSYLMRSTRYLLTIHQHRRNYLKIDIFFRAVYPVIYIIYNIWYWMSFP